MDAQSGHAATKAATGLFAALRRRSDAPILWILGPLPPPVNGQSRYNREIIAFFAKERAVVAVSTGASAHGKILRALCLPAIGLLLARRRDQIYISPPGQNGLWLFLPLILVLRLRGLAHYTHHHSFRPINLGPLAAHRWLCRIGGRFQRHIFLSPRMRTLYGALYLSSEQFAFSRILPNAFLFSSARNATAPRRAGPIVIGHLSVMTRAKGVDYLLELCDRLVAVGADCRLVLAGPIADAGLVPRVEAAIARHGTRVAWLGPVYGAAKEAFYREVDLFALPSTLVDEADPLVLIEAYRQGCDVVATDVGCISERIRSPDALLSLRAADDAAMLAGRVRRLHEEREAEAAACIAHAQSLHERSLDYARTLFAEFDIILKTAVD